LRKKFKKKGNASKRKGRGGCPRGERERRFAYLIHQRGNVVNTSTVIFVAFF